MAPRRTAAKTAVTEAAEFNFDEFLSGFHRPEFSRDLIRRADLAPKLLAEQKILDDLDDRIEKLEKDEGDEGKERDITEVNPLAVLRQRREVATLAYNEIAQTYNDSAVSFSFRVPDKKDDHETIQALMDEAGIAQPVAPVETGVEDDDKAARAAFDAEFEVWWDALAIRSMSVTCTSHVLTVDQWEQLRDRVGVMAFSTLATAWFEAVQAATPTAAFLPRRLPTPDAEASSPESEQL